MRWQLWWKSSIGTIKNKISTEYNAEYIIHIISKKGNNKQYWKQSISTHCVKTQKSNKFLISIYTSLRTKLYKLLYLVIQIITQRRSRWFYVHYIWVYIFPFKILSLFCFLLMYEAFTELFWNCSFLYCGLIK